MRGPKNGGWKEAKKYPAIPARVPLRPNPKRCTGIYFETVCSNSRGTYCTNPKSIPNLIAMKTAEHFARRMGWTFAQAHQALMIFGQTLQECLLRGEPCGIPFVGALYVKKRRVVARVQIPDALRDQFTRLGLYQPAKWDHFYAQRSPYTGTPVEWVRAARAAAEKHVRKVKPVGQRRRSGVYTCDTNFPKVPRGTEHPVDY